MGRQFKTIAPASGQTMKEVADLDETISMQDTLEMNSAQKVRPSLRLPMRSSAPPVLQESAPERETSPVVPEPRMSVAERQNSMPGTFQHPLSENGVAPTGFANPISRSVRPVSALPVTPWPESVPGQREEPRTGNVRPVAAENQPQQLKTSKKRKRPPLLIAAIIGCLSVLLLSGGGFWLYHGRGSVSNTASPTSATPAARPTEYTIVIPDKTGATPTATATTKTGKGTDRFNLNSVLSPVPLPWQTNGPLIVVSINAQKLTAYDNGKPAMTILVTTGMPALFTPEGTYHIIGRIANAMFTSPWPPSSPYYYAPIHVNYGLKLTDSGIYLHDATWRSVFGPGTNVPHKDPVYGEESGSHGCVELPLQAMQWLYNWAPNGITVAVVP